MLAINANITAATNRVFPSVERRFQPMKVIVRGSPNDVKNPPADSSERGSVRGRGGGFPNGFRQLSLVSAVAVLSISAATVGFFLLREPLRGSTDHGDFHRVMTPAGLVPLGDAASDRNSYVHRMYRTRTAHPARASSSGAWIAFVAARVPGPFVDGPRVDVRRFGLASGLIALGFLVLGLARGVGASRLLMLVLMLAAPDVLLSWNGLHPDVAATLGILGVVVGLIEGRPDRSARRLRASSLVLGALLLAFSSRAHAFVPLLVGISLIAVDRSHGSRALTIGIGAISVAGVAHFEWGDGPRFDAINRYHAVYRGLAEVADDPDAVLREFGLGADTSGLVGRSRFVVELAPETERAVARVSRVRLAAAYLVRPIAIARTARRILRTLADPRPPRDGSFERTTPATPPRPAGRGVNLRAARTSLGVLGVLGVLGGAVGVIAMNRRRDRRELTRDARFFVFALLLVVTEPLVVVLGDGTFSLRRHLMLSSMVLDLCAGLLAIALVDAVIARRRSSTTS